MARYYFDILEDNHLYRDDDGEECASIEQARIETARTMIELAREKLSAFDGYRLFIQVRDEAGKPVLRASLAFNAEDLSVSSQASMVTPA